MDLHAQTGGITVPTLRTQRLLLRGLRESDLNDVVRYADDYEVSKWLVPVAHPYTHTHAQQFLQRNKAGEIGALWVMIQDGAFVGSISIGKELGYWLARPAWGQGLMTEAAQTVIAHHFDTTDTGTIYSSHFVENIGSKRVLEKCGFVAVGGHIHHSLARQADVPGRSMELSRARWDTLQNG